MDVEIPKSGVWSTLSNPKFRLLLSSELILQIGRWMDITVLGWIVLQMTDSVFQVALVGFYRTIALAILGPFSGMLADRLPRKKLLIGSACVSAIASATLATLMLADTIQVWHISVITIVLGVCFSIDFPSRRSLILDFVGSDRVVNAISLEGVGAQFSRIMGPLVAGILLSIAGPGVAYTLVSAAFVLSVIPLLLMPTPPQRPPTGQNPLHDLAAGLAYAVRQPVIFGVLVVTIVWNIFVFPHMSLLSVFARDVLHGGPGQLGILSAAPGVGSFIGALSLANSGRLSQPGKLFLIACAVFGIGVLLFALSDWFLLSVAMLFVVGLGQSIYFVLQSTLVLTSASEQMRGRAMGALSMAIGAGPFGLLLIGSTSREWGTQVAVACAAAIALAVLILIYVLIPSLRKAQTMDR